MIFYYRPRQYRIVYIVGIFLYYLSAVSSHEDVLSNHQTAPDTSTLKIEAKESEASIILGKDLVLSPHLSSKALIIPANSSFTNDITTPKIDLLATPTSITRAAFGSNVPRKQILKYPSSRTSYLHDNGYWISKSPKSAEKTDSYLEALRHSRNSDDPHEGIVGTDTKAKINRREHVQGPVYKQQTEYGSLDVHGYSSKRPQIVYEKPADPSSVNGPSDSYSQPSKSIDPNDRYGPPQNTYGPPQNSYLPPHSSNPAFYPHSSYGPPGNPNLSPQQEYGTSIHTSAPVPIYGEPYALPDVSHISIMPSIDLGLPFALKLNAFTIAKIILKLVIFKLIVKFIAIICLLLFIPKLEIVKKDNNDDNDEDRSLSSPYASSETLNNLASIVRSAVEEYKMQNSAHSNSTRKCTTHVCRITKALTFHESWSDYLNLFRSYVKEEEKQAIQGNQQ